MHRRTLLIALVAATCCGPALVSPVAAGRGGGSALRLLRVHIVDPIELHALQRLGIDILSREAPGRVRVAASDQDIATLDSEGYQYEIIERDLKAYYLRRLGDDAQRYHTLDEVVQELDRLHVARPDIVGRRLSIGTTWEGRSIWAVKISDHPELDEDEPEVLFDALHHAREPVGMEALLHGMWHLALHYDGDPEIRYLVQSRELWFVPVVNPDGYAHNGVGGLWRKNRRPNGDGSFGVDLNRNYGFRWGYDDLGSSPTPASQTYRGPQAFSEPESRAMRDFILSREFVTGMTVHAFSDIHLLPYGWAEVRPERWAELRELGRDLQRWTGYPYGQPWELLYFSNGRTQDWAYHEAGITVIEPEIGRAADGFWPPAERVAELCERNLPSILHVARIAGPHLEPIGHVVLDEDGDGDGDGSADPGETVRLLVELRNKGHAGLGAVTAALSSATADVIVHSAPVAVGAVPARTTLDGAALPFRLTISPTARPGAPITLDLDLAGDGGYVGHQIVTLVPGTPQLVLADGADNAGGGLGRWRTTGGWGIVELGGAAGRGYADSPGGAYAPGSDNSLCLREPLDLSDFTHATLTYRERFWTEPWSDLCRVEARARDRGWETLATIPGGAQTDLRSRRVALDRFAGEPSVHLRFRLTANAMNEKDGWTIDDIEIWGYRPRAAAAAAAPAPAAAAAAVAWRPENRRFTPGVPASIRLALDAEQRIELGLLDAAGQRVVTLATGPFAAGEHVVFWDGRDRSGQPLSTGVYFYELVTPSHRETRRLVVESE